MVVGHEEDVVELLIAQHNQIKELMGQLVRAVGPAKQRRFEELVRLLAVHESAEKEVVHPTARRLDVNDRIVDSRLQEEQEAERELAALHELGVQHADFDSRFGTFADKLIEHAESEEREEFGGLLRCSAQDRARLTTALRIAEDIAPTRPHPDADVAVAENLMSGPPRAVFDRVRDAIIAWKRQSEDA